VVNFGISAVDPRTVRPKEIFLKKLCQKPQILNKPQRLADRPPHSRKLTCLKIFNETFLSIEIATHLNAIACKFLIKVALWKVKPMKLIPLDSTAIYPINPIIYHHLTTLWPAKIKTLTFTFAFSSFPTHDIQAIFFHIP
jgi:hypothetical protein